MLTNTQKQMVTNLRLQGLTYAEIAAATELSPNTVKSFCRRSHIKLSETEPADSNICKNCGRPLTQQIGTKKSLSAIPNAVPNGGTKTAAGILTV